MDHTFPYRLEPAPTASSLTTAGGMLLQFDLPEAHGFALTAAAAGSDPALDCLIVALGGYIKLGRAIPRPSPAQGRPRSCRR